MTKTYSYDLSIEDLTRLQNQWYKVSKILESDEFKNYIGERIMEALKFIQKHLLSTIQGDDMKAEMSNYIKSNHLEIKDDIIYVYNDATIDISTKYMKPTTKAKYPAQLSLAKIVEYGIGYTGGAFTEHQDEVEDWQYDVNNHGYEGWYYMDESGKIHWTNGFAGRMIFYHLKEFVKLNIEQWIIDYMNDNL